MGSHFNLLVGGICGVTAFIVSVAISENKKIKEEENRRKVKSYRPTLYTVNEVYDIYVCKNFYPELEFDVVHKDKPYVVISDGVLHLNNFKDIDTSVLGREDFDMFYDIQNLLWGRENYKRVTRD